ncbi:hypothetical protein FHL15_011344 [Xylaria flabelliformis]|uniref:Tachykinin family protein n=1 Tax=Xylaria flabelliformis TaxID=2512241 RepID=A0A553HIK7_9PEZI|nr:hypothetical protein FHL15_011344 [Xylaria flabelliformis]
MPTNSKKGPELCFMVKTSMDGFKPEDRKLIRSHVMKGKNLGRIRPLGSRRHQHPSDERKKNYDDISDNSSLSRISSRRPPHSEHETSVLALGSIPPRVGSVASTMHLADTVKPATIEVVLQFVPRRPFRESQRVRHHYQKAVSLLRQRLLCDDNDIRLSNNTISIVLSFAGQAFSSGDLKSAINHLQGIQKIVDLRGGFSSIIGNEKLINEILRCDLGIAIYSGSNPILFRGVGLSHAYRVYPKLDLFLNQSSLDHTLKSHEFLKSLRLTHDIEINDQLAAAWNAMSDFCSIINLAANTEQRIDVRTLLYSMASIMYNLLDMRFESTSWDESIRLGLLSFSCSVFLPWARLGISYPHLKSIVRNQFASLIGSSPSMPPKLVMWLLMAGAVGVLDEPDCACVHDLLLDAANSYGIKYWSQMRDMLNSLMWIGIVHDKQGKRVFDSAIGRYRT